MVGSRRIVPILLIAAVFGLGIAVGAGSTMVLADHGGQANRDTLFQPFWETWDLIHDSFVDPVDETVLMEGALSGLLDSLSDEHSFYMDPETFDMVNNDLKGSFEGIGATVRQDEDSGALVIVDTLPDSPAARAGLKAGDAVFTVDGQDVTSLRQTDIVRLIRGAEGTVVVLGIMREGQEQIQLFELERARIEIASVNGEMLEGDILYVQLLQFGAETASELRDVLVEFGADDRAGLIVDFRGNPGGYLNTAVDVASEFLEDGLVVKERMREGERDYPVNGEPIAPSVPVVILVDAGSASASELVAGALQDAKRAVIVGEPTFGKGSVQTWRQLSNGGGVRMTIARWYTPSDRTIEDTGLMPDIVIAEDDLPATDLQLDAAVEALLELERVAATAAQ